MDEFKTKNRINLIYVDNNGDKWSLCVDTSTPTWKDDLPELLNAAVRKVDERVTLV